MKENEMYPQCNEIKCEWHMGFGHKKWPFMNNACYLTGGEHSMFCPKNLNVELNPRREEGEIKP